MSTLLRRRLKAGARLVIASHNPGKVRELADLIAPLGIDAISAAELDIEEPEETGNTFEENAAIKAVTVAQATGLPALADDSGLEVDAIGGEPGIFSARWAGPDEDFARAMGVVEERLQEAGANNPAARRGRFVAVLCLGWPDGERRYWRGEIAGELVWPPRGNQGFGYDPVFRPDGHERTFGEMNAEEKHGWWPGAQPLSHRAKAFALFAQDLNLEG